MPARTFVMGDIHGRYDALTECLNKSAFDNESDHLIQLGDVCDRGEETARVVDRLLKIKHLTALKGNHDLWMEQWLKTGYTDPIWLRHGGEESIRSYQTVPTYAIPQHIDFFKNQRYYYIDSHNNLFLHAGFTDDSGPAHEAHPENVCWDRTLWLDAYHAFEAKEPPPQRLSLFKTIFIGHTSTLKQHSTTSPICIYNLWNVDTGAGTYGKLTMIDINTLEVFQSSDVR